MLILKSQSKPKPTVDSVRTYYRKTLRRNDIQHYFSLCRNGLLQNNQNSQLPMPHPNQLSMLQLQFFKQPSLFQQPLNQQCIDYISYILRNAQQPPANYTYIQPQLPAPQQPLQILIQNKIELERYQIYFQKQGYVVFKKLLGEGSYAKVYLGNCRQSGQRVAIKQVSRLEAGQAKCQKQLNSPQIIRIFDVIEYKKKKYLVLQYCDRNLRQQMVLCNFHIGRVLDIFQQIVIGMDVLQSNNILHRDLKLQNILIKNGQVKIADFGLAKQMGNQLKVQSRRCGTAYTMAPQIYFSNTHRTPYTIKCDIWSIGVILHEMLYQQHPFNSNSSDFKHQRRIVIDKRFGLLDTLIDCCLVFDPVERIGWDQFKQIFLAYKQAKYNQKTGDKKTYKKRKVITEEQMHPEGIIEEGNQKIKPFKRVISKINLCEESEQECKQEKIFKKGRVQPWIQDCKKQSLIYQKTPTKIKKITPNDQNFENNFNKKQEQSKYEIQRPFESITPKLKLKNRFEIQKKQQIRRIPQTKHKNSITSKIVNQSPFKQQQNRQKTMAKKSKQNQHHLSNLIQQTKAKKLDLSFPHLIQLAGQNDFQGEQFQQVQKMKIPVMEKGLHLSQAFCLLIFLAILIKCIFFFQAR